jgi:uncharacterized phage-associated protein
MLKLLKLMYLADRKSLLETGVPITGDSISALDKGPVLSQTYNRLKPAGALPFVSSEPGNVTLQTPPQPLAECPTTRSTWPGLFIRSSGT